MDPFTDDQVDYLARYLAKTFISRKDVKAEQMPFHKGSAYRPIHEPWKLSDLRAHVRGEKTFGHYLLDQDSMVKFIAFDVDLEKQGTYCDFSFEAQEALFANGGEVSDFEFYNFNPRESWLDHSHVARPWMTHQMKSISSSVSRAIEELGLKSYATYSGSKGVHIYGIFDELVPAETAREVAFEVLEKTPGHGGVDSSIKFTPTRGKNFYHLAPNWDLGSAFLSHLTHFDLFDNFTVEVFPKQSHIEPLRLGNLMRLDFGKNLKAPEEQTFVIDMEKSDMRLESHDTFEELKAVLEHGYNW